MTPIKILTCRGCGACCQHVGVPMGFYPAIGGSEYGTMEPENTALWETLPEDAREIYIRTWDAYQRGEYDIDGPCCWLDQATQRCRFHDHRPRVCRDFEVGGGSCLGWRRVRGIDEWFEQQFGEDDGRNDEPDWLENDSSRDPRQLRLPIVMAAEEQ